MTALRRQPLLVVAVTAFSLVGLAISAVQISRFVRFGDIVDVGHRLQRGQALTRETVARFATRAEEIPSSGICQRDFVKSGLEIVLVDLDNQNLDQDYDGWARAMARAEIYTGFALGCTPTDGDFWLRHAMVRQAISEQPTEIARLLTLSQRYAPAEGNVIAGRYRLYNRVTPSTLDLASSAVEADLQVICSNVGRHLRRRLPPAGPTLTPILARAAPGCEIGEVAKPNKARRL